MNDIVPDFFLRLVIDRIINYHWSFMGKFTYKLPVHLANGDDLVTLAEDPQTYCPIKQPSS